MSKPILIILPGWGGTKETWRDFITLAQTKFVVHCLELPGFGSEPAPDTVWGVEEYANFVKRKINTLGIGKKIILGHSFGGQVAAQLVATNVGICDTLILSGPAVFRKKKSLRRIIFWPIAKIGGLFFALWPFCKLRRLATKILYKLADSPDYQQTSGTLRQVFQKITTQDLGEVLKDITVPTLVLAGTKDNYVSSANSRQVASRISQARYVEFPGLGHGLHHQPEQMLAAITQFLAE